MMMGHRERLKKTDEEEAFSKSWRHYIRWKSGELKRIKRRYHKRLRKKVRMGNRKLLVSSNESRGDHVRVSGQV
jgi:hypothetical protein